MPEGWDGGGQQKDGKLYVFNPSSFFPLFKVNLAWVWSREAELVQRDKKLELEARKKFYKSVKNKEKGSRKTKLKRVILFTKLVNT